MFDWLHQLCTFLYVLFPPKFKWKFLFHVRHHCWFKSLFVFFPIIYCYFSSFCFPVFMIWEKSKWNSFVVLLFVCFFFLYTFFQILSSVFKHFCSIDTHFWFCNRRNINIHLTYNTKEIINYVASNEALIRFDVQIETDEKWRWPIGHCNLRST